MIFKKVIKIFPAQPLHAYALGYGLRIKLNHLTNFQLWSPYFVPKMRMKFK